MSKKESHIEVPLGATNVLLHTCCAPCSSAIVEWMMQHNVKPTLYFFNPNIYPEQEYLIRKEECIRYARTFGLDVIDADYIHKDWRNAMKGLEKEPERGSRCLKCFKFRLMGAARYAHEHNFTILTTTLASSRWKSLEQVSEAGSYAVSMYPDVIFWAQNWRKHGLSERRNAIIREHHFYNQQYCGCEFSLEQTIAFRKAKIETQSSFIRQSSESQEAALKDSLHLQFDLPIK